MNSITTASDTGGSSTTETRQQAERHAEEAQRELEKGKQAAAEAAEAAQQKTKQVAEDARQEAEKLAEEVQQSAQAAGEKLQRKTVQVVEKQKSAAAEEISTFRDAIHAASHKLREEDNERVAEYAESAADTLGQAADYLRDRNLSELTSDIENFARRRPEFFYGGLLATGLAVSRFLKASSERRRADTSGSRHQQNISHTQISGHGLQQEYGAPGAGRQTQHTESQPTQSAAATV